MELWFYLLIATVILEGVTLILMNRRIAGLEDINGILLITLIEKGIIDGVDLVDEEDE